MVKTWIKELFSEKGRVSMVRFLSLVSVFTACIIGILAVRKGLELNSAATLCGVFLGAGFGAKVAQKAYEVKGQDSEK